MVESVLGIETSCDETAVAIYSATAGILGHQVYSQIEVHQEWGGVVPELASRDHIRKILPLVEATLNEANMTPAEIDGVAYTRGPGLIGALMVGASVARSLSYGWHVPALGVHHMEAHLMAVMLEEQKPEYPFVALLISGGHTMLVEVKGLGQYTLLGESIDDAVGEAFDKTAKLLGLPYPGGPHLAKLAESGNCNRFQFPRPMLKHKNCDFSFSGLKTHALNVFQQSGDDPQTKADIACAFQEAVVETVIAKCKRALEQTGLDRLVMVGGVSRNAQLRAQLAAQLQAQVFYPRPEYCTDNGAMVAYLGWLRLSAGERDGLEIKVQPRWSIINLSSPCP